jgi:vacuolar protein sorting-associated protein 54
MAGSMDAGRDKSSGSGGDNLHDTNHDRYNDNDNDNDNDTNTNIDIGTDMDNELDLQSSATRDMALLLEDSAESVLTQTPNSIHDLVKNVNYRIKSTTTSLLAISSTSTVISLNGPTAKDIPPTRLSTVTVVDDATFEHYVDTIEDFYDDFSSAKSLTSQTLSKLDANDSDDGQGSERGAAGEREREREKEKEIFNPLNEEQEAMLDSNKLSNVPDFYFRDDFRLDDPRVFRNVTENRRFLSLIDDDDDYGNLKHPNSASGATAVDHEQLQDNLSSYLDIVEVNLLHEISKSSENFFSALDDLKKITTSAEHLSTRLQSVDGLLRELKSSKIIRASNLVNLLQKYQNIEAFNQVLLQIKTILSQADFAEDCYYKGDYDRSLQLIDSVFALIKGNVPPHPFVDEIVAAAHWRYPLKDLNKLPALFPLKRLLSNLISDTGKSYAKLFANFLIDDLRYTYENVDTYRVLQRILSNTDAKGGSNASSSSENYNIVSDVFKERITSYIRGLTRCGELSSAFRLYEEQLVNELKWIFKSNLPTDKSEPAHSSARSDDSRSTTVTNTNTATNTNTNSATTAVSNALVLSDLVKNMTPKEFEAMLVDDYVKFSETFRRLSVHKNLLLSTAVDTLNAFDPHILKVQPDIVMDLDITPSTSSAIASIQRRMAKVIRIRELQNSYTPLNLFLRFYSLNANFLVECEVVSRGLVTDPILKDVVNRQLMIFVQQFHKSSLKRCIQLIEQEVWKDDGLVADAQDTLELIFRASEGKVDDEEWLKGLSLDFEDYNPIRDENATTDTAVDTSAISTTKEVRKTLNIHSQSYILPSSVAHILGTLRAYLLLAHYFKTNINSIISQTYLPELLKAINLKIHQSVLGTQATKTAGLKHITTKHLALAGEVCRFWNAVVVDLERVCLSELDNVTTTNNRIANRNNDRDVSNQTRANIIKEFNEVRGLFGEQVVDIYDKLVSIMRDTMLAVVQNVDINLFVNANDVNEKDVTVNSYMESIVKKTLTIARSVQRYLPEEEYDGIMRRIFAEYVKILGDKYLGILMKCSEEQKLVAKVQIVEDMRFFGDKLADVQSSEGTVERVFERLKFKWDGTVTEQMEQNEQSDEPRDFQKGEVGEEMNDEQKGQREDQQKEVAPSEESKEEASTEESKEIEPEEEAPREDPQEDFFTEEQKEEQKDGPVEIPKEKPTDVPTEIPKEKFPDVSVDIDTIEEVPAKTVPAELSESSEERASKHREEEEGEGTDAPPTLEETKNTVQAADEENPEATAAEVSEEAIPDSVDADKKKLAKKKKKRSKKK